MHLLAHRLAVRELPDAGLALARVHCSHLANGLRCLPSISVEAENRAIIRLSLLQQGELGFRAVSHLVYRVEHRFSGAVKIRK